MSSRPAEGVPQKPALPLPPGQGALRQKYLDMPSFHLGLGGLRKA